MKNEGSFDWTDGAVSELKRFWAEGFSAGQVARMLGGGLSRNAVLGKIHRLKIAQRPKAVVATPKRPARVPKAAGRPEAARKATAPRVPPRPRRPEDAVVVVPEGLGVAPLSLPRSEISIADDAAFGQKVPVQVPRWLALDRGLIAAPDPNQGALF